MSYQLSAAIPTRNTSDSSQGTDAGDFATPATSTASLKQEPRYLDSHTGNSPAKSTSPTKSTMADDITSIIAANIASASIPPPILKRQSGSPKKVVFNKESPEVFHYHEPDSSMVSDLSEQPPSPPPHKREYSDKAAYSDSQLDAHLEDLPRSARAATESNIHHLVSTIQTTPQQQQQAQPVFQDSSFGSSQSSLQSLKSDNRVLDSVEVNNATGGLVVNDGIRGIPDDLAETMISQQQQGSGVRRRVTQFNQLSDAYNSAEQSIMSLLNGSSADLIKDERDLLETPTFAVKPEFEAISPVLNPSEETIKSEFKEEEDVKSVKSESVYPLVEPQGLGMKIIHHGEDDSQTSIRFQADNDWKLEDSNDGDREDNDETNMTMGSVLDEQSEQSEQQHEKEQHEKEQERGQQEQGLHVLKQEHTQDNDCIKEEPHDRIKEEPFDSDPYDSDPYDPHGKASQAAYDSHENADSHEDPDSHDTIDYAPSDNESHATLDPSRLNSPKDDPEQDDLHLNVSDPVHPSPEHRSGESTSRDSTSKSQDEPQTPRMHGQEDDILANSSNIAPPEEITLPAIDTNHSSFEEFARSVTNVHSFEDSLSAEYDMDNKELNFISIWHSQSQKRQSSHEKAKLEKPEKTEKTDKTLEPPADRFVKGMGRRFKDVQVKSRRIVSPDFEDLSVSGFLPELSEDSGFETHFKFLRNVSANASANANASLNAHAFAHGHANMSGGSANVSGANGSMSHGDPLSTKNVLSNIDSDPRILEPPQPTTYRPRTFKPTRTSSQSYRPPHLVQPTPPRSRFRVPTFEIKRSTSILSPHFDLYNEIFEDVLKKGVTTIKGAGMKTLPSMDREDVKRILNTKRVITQEEYTNDKFSVRRGSDRRDRVGSEKLEGVYARVESEAPLRVIGSVARPPQRFDEESHHASICNVSDETFELLPHLAEELTKSPSALLSKEQLFASDIWEDNASVVHRLPEPDKDLVNTPKEERGEMVKEEKAKREEDIFKTPQKKLDVSRYPSGELDEETRMKYNYLQAQPVSPTKSSPSKAIKISGPVIVKNGDGFTAMSPKKVRSPQGSLPLSEGLEEMEDTVQEPVPEPAPVDYDDASVISFRERGRLFFRVVGFKDIRLPNIDHNDASFSITLDNGVHCIRTPEYKMSTRNVPIGKEFELTVGETLEFILTMKATYTKPKGGYREVTESRTVKSKNRLSRLFGGSELVTTTRVVPVNAKDPWEHVVANDGSFGRCYVDLEQFEEAVTGEVHTFNLTCYNEWESVTNAKGQVINKKNPYRVGELEVRMLFVPRVDPDEILPTSIKSAYESIDALRAEANFAHEGYLHQEGGDCDTWKRRFFKLNGLSLIAHSEYSHKTRAKINLSKVVDVSYVDKENVENKSYRNFSGVLLLDHAFKIQFANGETIDFGAPNKQEKMEWIRIIERIIKRNRFRRQPWVKLMLQHADEQAN